MIPEMYKHQKEVVERVQKSKEIALFHGLGSGKTRSVIECLREIFNSKKVLKRTLILGPTSVVFNWKNQFGIYSKIPEERIYPCVSASNRDVKLKRAIENGATIITLNYEALVSKNILKILLDWKPEILVADECLQEGSLVDMADGSVKKIEDIIEGDRIKNILGEDEVIKTHKVTKDKLIVIHFEGKELRVSLNHPILTLRGWQKAEDIKKGDYLVRSNKTMLTLWEDIHTNGLQKHRNSLSILLKRVWMESACELSKDARLLIEQELHEKTRNSCESKRNVSKGWCKTISKAWEWVWSNRPRKNDNACHSYNSMECSCSNKTKSWIGIPNSLQDRPWFQRVEDWYRSRWALSQPSTETGTGFEERFFSYFARVDNTSLQEQGSNKEFGPSSFYDLTIKNHPSFSSNGVIVHNCHMLKSPTSIRSKAAFEIAKLTEYRFILTGTPILQNAMDLFQEFKILDLGKTFGKNFFTFRAEFFMDKNAAWASSPNHFPLWVPRPDKEKELLDRVSRKAHVVYTKDCIDLPPYIEKTEYVEMTADQRKAYEQMKDFFMTFIQENSSNPAVASIAPVKALRMLQIVSGHLTLEDKTNYVFQGTPKLKRLEELLEEIVGHSKVVIWTTFKEDIRLIGKMLQENKWRFVVLSGDQDTQEKQQALDSFKIDQEISVMLANRKAGGTGCEMTAASYSISFSRGFSLGEELQSRARTYRGGSQIHEKIYHIDLCVKDSIDELVVQAIANKEDIGKKVLEAAKNKNLK